MAKGKESLHNYYKTHDGSWKGKHHTDESKAKISASRKKFLQEHPEQASFRQSPSYKESFPEKYFRL